MVLFLLGDIIKLRETVEEEIKAIGKRREVTAENEEEEMEEGSREREEGEVKDTTDNLEKNDPTHLDMEVAPDDIIDESKENFPLLMPVEQPTNTGMQELEMVITEPGRVDDVNHEHEILAQKPSFEESYLIQDDDKEGSEEREIDTLDPNRLTEKEFEPIYD